MKIKTIKILALAGLILAAGFLAVPNDVYAQEKLQKSPGGYHGEMDFPISWSRYYTYPEWTKILHDIQKQYPELADIQSIGKSRMGRDQYLITITAKSTGKPEDKPAMWVDGAIHGNEVNGITCSLYLMWYLLTRYDYDSYVHNLVKNCTFYILPGLNVDANNSFVEFPNTANNPREPFRPEDDDGDGLYDEDRTEDVDGDGELSYMYIEDPKGDFKLSPDKRQFIPVSDPREEGLRFRRVGDEGYDNDGDGLINEDDIGGPDPNRNYPADWNLEAGNPYPMSEYCTRNVHEFMLKHPNIFASFHFHNTGRLIMFTAPPRVYPMNNLPADQKIQAQERFEQYLEEMRQTNKYAQAFEFQAAPGYEEDMAAQLRIVNMGARILKNYRPTPSGGSGQAQAASYTMLGAYAYLIELWGSPVFDADEDDDGQVSDDELLKWIDIELTGEGWITPHKCMHSDLGEIWIGGSRKKHIGRTPPARYIKMEAEKNALFVMYCASQFPKVEISDIRVTPETDNLFWIDIEVKNDKDYPTISDRSLKLKRTRMDKISIGSTQKITQIDLPEGSAYIYPYNDEGKCQAITSKGAEFRLKGKDKQHFSALVELEGSSGWLEVTVDSQHGGIVRKKISIKKD
jgi:hypothetical protein